MTQYNKSSLAAFFETGDVPSGTNYSDFIDSCINAVETTAQSMAGALVMPELVATRVSATNVNITGTFSANSVTFNGTVSAANVHATNIRGTTVSANALNITTNVSADGVYASAARVGGLFLGSGTVSAAGSTQAAATALTFSVNIGRGVADGETTGYGLLANRTGQVQYLFNNGASANLWPPTGGTINGLAANTAYSLGASAMVTIVHIGASAYAVK